jgi:glc operon protein GlcG
MKRFSVLLALAAGVAPAFAADVVDQPALTLEGAKSIAAAAVAYAKAKRAPGGAIAVVDVAGTVIYLERLDDTFPNASEVAIGKARTAALFRKPTRAFEEAVNQGRYAMLSVPAVAPFTALQGGVPVELHGKVVGAIGVSGAASAAQDEEIASAGAARLGKGAATVSDSKDGLR